MVLPHNIYKVLANIASPGKMKGKLQVFIFHRVLYQLDPLMPEEPDIKQFEILIAAIANIFNVMPLGEAVERLNTHSLPKRAACITFDDGYLDNYTNAMPVLHKYRTPATVFIATHFLSGEMMWNDIVIESIRFAEDRLNLPDIGVPDAPVTTIKEKKALIDKIIPLIKHMPYKQRADIVEHIAEISNFRPFSLMMNQEKLIDMRRSGIEIGAHTSTHPILKMLSDREAEKEIVDSKDYLEGLLGESIGLFAYPNGRPDQDYTKRDVDIVKKTGFTCAVSTNKKIATESDSRFEIPRFTPWDTNINKFILRSLLYTLQSKIEH